MEDCKKYTAGSGHKNVLSSNHKRQQNNKFFLTTVSVSACNDGNPEMTGRLDTALKLFIDLSSVTQNNKITNIAW
jgi:hypothetical protein